MRNPKKLIYNEGSQKNNFNINADVIISRRDLADAVHLSDVELHGQAVGTLVGASLNPVISRTGLGSGGKRRIHVDVDFVLHEESLGGAELARRTGESKGCRTSGGRSNHLSVVL